MLRKIKLKSARTTRPKLEAVPGAPVVTWNTGDIEQVRTRKEPSVMRWTWRDVAALVACILLALLIAGLVVFGFALWTAVVAVM